jgi:DNA-binding beta-propeller fold protein YncE
MKDDVVALTDNVDRCKVESLRLERGKADFAKATAKIRTLISDHVDQLKRLIDNEAAKLTEELSAAMDDHRREVEAVEGVLSRQQVSLETFSMYSEEMFDHGTACDVASEAESMHRRAKGLEQFDVSAYINSNLRSVDLTFVRSDIETLLAGNIVGKLVIKKVESGKKDEHSQQREQPTERQLPQYPQQPAEPVVVIDGTPLEPVAPQSSTAVGLGAMLTHRSTSPGQPVLGVTILNDDLYVVRHKTPDVEVYDAQTLTIKRQITVPGLGSWPYGLAACSVNHFIYVSDFVNNVVHRIDAGLLATTGNNARWPVSGGPAGLALDSDRNIIVACSTVLKIRLYSTQGSLLMDLSLPAELAGLSHVVHLAADQFVVSHGTSSGQLQRICIINKGKDDGGSDSSGETSSTAGDAKGSRRHKRIPIHIHRKESKATTSSVKAPVAGSVRSDDTVSSHKPLEAQIVVSFGAGPGKGERQLNGPKGLALDGQGRVFVADRDNDRIVIVDVALDKGHDIGLDDVELQGPRCLCLDESRGRLYVGEESGGRVVVFDNIRAVFKP